MKPNFKLLAVLVSFAVVLSAGADVTFRALQANGTTYRNVTITAVTATDIYFTYSGGMGNAKLRDLSPALQQRFHYDPDRAAAQEQHQAQANAQFQANSSGQWGTDLPTALNQAQSQHKLVLMDFTGSDWCPWCIKLDQEVFSTGQFIDYAQRKLELVRVDFPRNTPQSEELKQANAALASRFNVTGYPTCILLDSSGRELGRQVGFLDGGVGAFLAEMDSFSPKDVQEQQPSQAQPQAAPQPDRAQNQPQPPQIQAPAHEQQPRVKWPVLAAIPVGLFIIVTGRLFRA
jgi:thiol:disulfide interchange protein